MALERRLLSELDDEVMLSLSLLVLLESLCVSRMSMGRNSESLSEWQCSESAVSAGSAKGPECQWVLICWCDQCGFCVVLKGLAA